MEQLVTKAFKHSIFLFLVFILSAASISAQTIAYKTLGTWNSSGVPDYLTAQDTVPSTLLSRIIASLPESKNLTTTHPEFLVSTNKTNLVLKDSADVFVTFLYEGAGYLNALGFYTYQANNPPTSVNDIKNTMTIIFPNSSASGSGGGLNAGNRVKIGAFGPNTVIGWFVVANGFSSSTATVGNGNWLLYSNTNLNPESDSTKRQHNVLLNDVSSSRIILGFEDIRRDNGSCDNDFNDVLFSVSANPYSAIDTTGLPVIQDPSQSDIAITKTVDNSSPKNNDMVTYTVTATNNGPSTATGVKVTDALPAGVVFQSATPSKGSYVSSTGLWTVGSLNKNESATLQIKVKIDQFSNSYSLGAASGFNVFVLNDINQPSADIEGKVAVGNNAYFSNYSVGDKLANSNGTEDVLIVNNNLSFTSGGVYGGNVVFGNVTNLPVNAVSIINGTLRQDHPIDFTAASNYLNNLSTTLSHYTVNGTTEFAWNGLTLDGTNALLNVFSVNGADLNSANSMAVNVPNGAVVVVNVTGSNIQWHGGLVVNGTAINNVIYNFPDAINLKISGIDVQGSILAPKAQLDYPAGVINGQVVAKNISGQGQFNNKLFLGNIPVDSKITNTASLNAVDQTDLASANNMSSASLNVSVPATPNNGSGSGAANVTWTPAGTFPAGEMVWTINNDQNNKMLVGTLGGKIFRTDDDGMTWNRINSDMSVTYIWSVACIPGKMFAATEKGLYSTANNGASWSLSAFAGKDVRAITVDKSGVLFAGTWGYGISKSTDNGSTWTDVTNNLSASAVHTIAVNAQNELFAGTFGSGVEKSTDHGATWTKLPVGYNFVWSLAIAPDNSIYAGTYGNGAYRSKNNGQSFVRSNNLSSQFIYGISVSPDGGSVYLCTWSSGVFVSTDFGSNWSSMGMVGYGASSAYFNPSAKALYVGTGDGKVYKGVANVSGIKDNSKQLTFQLAQNFPNPFNPSTTISYSIAEDANVKLELYSVTGQLVKTLLSQPQARGSYSVTFSAENLSSGMYIYRLTAGTNVQVKKLVLLK